MVKDTESFETLNGLLKLIPLWLAWIIGKIYFFKENYLVFFMQESKEIKPEEGAFSLFILSLDELMRWVQKLRISKNGKWKGWLSHEIPKQK